MIDYQYYNTTITITTFQNSLLRKLRKAVDFIDEREQITSILLLDNKILN